MTRATNNDLSAAPLTPLREVDAIASKFRGCGYENEEKRAWRQCFCWVSATLRLNCFKLHRVYPLFSVVYEQRQLAPQYAHFKKIEPETTISGSTKYIVWLRAMERPTLKIRPHGTFGVLLNQHHRLLRLRQHTLSHGAQQHVGNRAPPL